jgi:hypothetical protein
MVKTLPGYNEDNVKELRKEALEKDLKVFLLVIFKIKFQMH